MTGRWFALAATSGLLLLAGGWTTSGVAEAAGREATADCQFLLGFRALHDLIPSIVGDCVENEWHNPENGDGLQQTTGGLMVWRKVDNWTAFTDGTTTWINGPLGLQSRLNDERFAWEGPPREPPAVGQPPAVPPDAKPLVDLAVADAAKRTGVDRSSVRVLRVDARDWPDASLGCPKPGQLYAQVITPGFLVVVEAGGQRFEYHTDTRQRIELC